MAAPVASTTFSAAGITSLPMPSPGTTAIRLFDMSTILAISKCQFGKWPEIATNANETVAADLR
jgi:hypothetical protein